MTGWNYADVWETIAEARPDAPAHTHGARHHTWERFDVRADGIAVALLEAGLGHQDRVALYLHNEPAYIESWFAACKAALVPFNTNYRYGRDELLYLWRDADARAVVFGAAFADTVDALREELPDVRAWLCAGDPCPEWAIAYEPAASSAPGRVTPPWGRSGDDRIFLYTGGTTGRPKGVVWRQHDLYRAADVCDDPERPDLAHVRSRLGRGEPPVGVPAPPLMHGTAFMFATTLLNRGGTVVTLHGRSFDAVALLDALTAERASALCIVGDAFCRPIVDALDAQPRRWDLGALEAVSSSGMVWSDAVKERLLEHAPGVLLIDFLNASEASGIGRSITSSRGTRASGSFRLGAHSLVVDDSGRPLTAPGAVGRVAVRGHVPLGYHKDPARSARTFPEIDGVRYAVPGDDARVESDGTVTLLGRGSQSINTGGEKVYPEEVEDALRSHPAVLDALVAGVPDERLGSVVAAVVAVRDGDGAGAPSAAALTEHVRGRLAGFKAPRRIVIDETVPRGPNGKADYAAARARLEEAVS